jgi:hypothetical protein
MVQETITYLTNIVIGVILAGLMTHYWWREGRTAAMRCWMLAAWVMTAADVFFALRQALPYAVGRLAPTLLVTVGHMALLLGAARTAGIRLRPRWLVGVFVLHAVGLALFLLHSQPSSWRMVLNSFVWGGLSVGAALCLRHAPEYFWKPVVAPAAAFIVHAVFHALRVSLATISSTQDWGGVAAALQIIGDLEVSFFMVALFVGILIANLQLRHEELSTAHAEVQTLSGLLPICAWCKKVRNDEGYWQQVEDYFACRSGISFTHGVCTECLEEQKKEDVRLGKN